ncbi:ATP-binding protein [Polymorphospora rubra]|uniref:ATP-binding protein n=1 Tax=Polymorphospora rubra TaxID=338584 RepID=UPI0033E515DF
MELIERDEELGRLREALGHAGDGQGRVVLITGAVASGKTALLHAFAEHVVPAGGRFLGAAGSRTERSLRFGIMGQLFHAARLPAPAAQRTAELLRDPAFAGELGDPGGETPARLRAGDQRRAQVLQELFTAVVDLGEQGPLVLAVDDLHHADTASLHCLLYLARRLRCAPVVLVLTESIRPQSPQPLFRAELLSQPYCVRVSLPPLSNRGLSQLAAARLDARASTELTDSLAISGGNPLLARALIEDQVWPADGSAPAALHLGITFGQAVLGCLYRHEEPVRQVARALAVLGDQAAPEPVARLIGVVPEAAAQLVRLLDMSGLTDRGRFRHAQMAATVLDDMPIDDRRELHARAANLLRDDGAAPTVVAAHLIAAGTTGDAPWTVPVLHDAAEQALAAGKPELAGSCLRLAIEAGTDERQRAISTALLVNAQWQVNPVTASGHLGELVAAARADRLPARETLATVPYLLWEGRVTDAVDALERVAADAERLPVETAARLRAMKLLVSASNPAHLAGVRQTCGTGTTMSAAPEPVGPPLQAVTLLAGVLTQTPDDELAAGAEHLLQWCEFDGNTLGPMTAALTALLYAGRADRAAVWGDLLWRRTAAGAAPIWQAVLRTVRAEAALRLGDLGRAQEQALAALAAVPARAWGVAIGAPLSTLLLAATETGNFEDAVRHLTVPVPAAMFDTPIGLHYLQARGRYHLATTRHHAAMNDFQTCAELMRRWGTDLPALVPWRLEMARTQLRLGRPRAAGDLIREQLHGAPGNPRVHGTALRLLAATVPIERRLALLKEAAEKLQAVGERVELAHTLADLGQTLRTLGDLARARAMVRRAYQLARECGAELLCRRLLLTEPGAGLSDVSAVPDEDADDQLSDAERRVAVLAARGYTNREIAARLHITVSTVEQHLTRVYRKLKVKRRAHLPAGLTSLADGLHEDLRLGVR